MTDVVSRFIVLSIICFPSSLFPVEFRQVGRRAVAIHFYALCPQHAFQIVFIMLMFGKNSFSFSFGIIFYGIYRRYRLSGRTDFGCLYYKAVSSFGS